MTPLVLVHGFLGGSVQWQAQRATFADRRVLAVDLPGFGARAEEPAPRTIEGLAGAALAEIAAAGIGRFDLLGHSMGGMVVQEMVAAAPDRVARLVLYATGPSGDLPDRFESFATSKRRAVADGARATARRIAAAWFRDGEAAPGYPLTAGIAERASLDAILAGLDAMAGWRGVALDRIACPTLVLWGDRDRTYGWGETERLWRGIPGASLAVVPGAGHAVHLETPGLFHGLVARGLDGA